MFCFFAFIHTCVLMPPPSPLPPPSESKLTNMLWQTWAGVSATLLTRSGLLWSALSWPDGPKLYVPGANVLVAYGHSEFQFPERPRSMHFATAPTFRAPRVVTYALTITLLPALKSPAVLPLSLHFPAFSILANWTPPTVSAPLSTCPR